jgi:ABC-type nitrate/sulfonate/bicarbonate transport system ATPase subunit
MERQLPAGHMITARDVHVEFPTRSGTPVSALAGFEISVAAGEFVSLIGPSGCGKSTALRLLAGLQLPTRGTVTLEHLGQPVTTAWMPQQDCLLPWRRAMSNALLGARIAGGLRPERAAEAAALFVEFGLGGFERAWPSQLSGGMRQRLALLRTYLTGADVLLLDEPFGALDPILRRRMNTWLADIWSAHPRTTVLVTHDVDEALVMSNRVLVLSDRPGRVVAEFAVTEPSAELRGDILEVLGSYQFRIHRPGVYLRRM